MGIVRGTRFGGQPILIFAEPAATSAARLPAVARIRMSLPFIWLRPPAWCGFHRALLPRGPFRFAWCRWLRPITSPGYPRMSRLLAGNSWLSTCPAPDSPAETSIVSGWATEATRPRGHAWTNVAVSGSSLNRYIGSKPSLVDPCCRGTSVVRSPNGSDGPPIQVVSARRC